MTTRIAIALLAALLSAVGAAAAEKRPNIVWVVVEDMSAHFGCYGEKTIRTPNVDRLAAEGVRFDRAFVTGPICSISRSALITGRYQTSIGAQHHRSGRGKLTIRLPEPVRPLPALLRAAGYQTLNLTVADFVRPAAEVRADASVDVAKTDYNFVWDSSIFDRTHWAARKPGQPFFVQVQLHGGKYRGQGNAERWPARVQKALGSVTPLDAVRLPPYLPADPVIVRDWAQYLDTVRFTDHELGRIVARLKDAGELDNTWIFFLTDHGISHVRNKQFLYDGGTRVPLIVRGPGLKPGVRKDLVEHIDLAAMTLALAGQKVPAWMHGRDVLAKGYEPRLYVFAARDRADETVDHIRSVRSDRYKYICNFLPQRPYLQPNRYKDNKPIVQAMRRLFAAGKLTPAQALIMAERRPKEELYDLEKDPHELNNLAADPAHAKTLALLRQQLQDWVVRTDDRGRTPESAAMYDSDMAVYVGKGNPVITQNIALMKRWAKEGK